MGKDVIKNVFASVFLKVLPDFGQAMDMLWAVFNFGGIIPAKIIAPQFGDEFEKLTNILTSAGLLQWRAGGQMVEGAGKEGFILLLDESAENVLREKKNLTFHDFREIISENYGEYIIRNIKSDLLESLSLMLETIIRESSPDTPVYLSSVLRIPGKIGYETIASSKLILDYYLVGYLELVVLDGFGVNLSGKSQELLKGNKELWELYTNKEMKRNTVIEERPAVEAPPQLEPRVRKKEVTLEDLTNKYLMKKS